MIFRERERRPLLAQLSIVFLEVAGLARLVLDAAEALFELLDDVLDAEQVLLDALELAFGLAFGPCSG